MLNFGPDNVLLMEQALQALRSGRPQHAEALCRQSLRADPNNAHALQILAQLAEQAGRQDVAEDLLRRAIAAEPEYAAAHCNLGSLLVAKGKLNEGMAECRRAIAIRPEFAEAYFTLGIALSLMGQLEEAVAAYRQAIDLMPGMAEAHNNLGILCQKSGQFDNAASAFRGAIAARPAFATAHINLGNVLQDLGHLPQAGAAYRAAIALEPGNALAQYNMGNALRSDGKLDEAAVAYHRALELDPHLVPAHHNLGSTLLHLGGLDQAVEEYRRAMELKPDFAKCHSSLVYALHFLPEYSGAQLANEHLRWHQQHAAPLSTGWRAHLNDRNPERRLRIGYVSPNFTAHPVGRFLLPLLANHDKRNVEVFGFADVTRPDAMTEELRGHMDHWRNIVGLSDSQVAELVRRDGIDVLVDLTMHMIDNRLLVFARKPAPVQVTHLAYCSTTGLQAMDYRLSDPHLDPVGADLAIYSERTVRLPRTYWCYQPLAEMPEVSELPVKHTGHVTFGCLNNSCKVNGLVVGAWGKIMRAVQGSRLLIHAMEGSPRGRLRELLMHEGIGPDRVQYQAGIPLPEYFRSYQGIDIALDPFPYGGGTTSCDALWMGVPLVTLKGRTAVGRGGASILSNLGLGEYAAEDVKEYVSIAVRLAGDLRRLEELRSGMRNQMKKSALMDGTGYARDMEAAYRMMWKQWCAALGA